MRGLYDPTGCLREDQIKRRNSQAVANIATGIIVVAVIYLVALLIWG